MSEGEAGEGQSKWGPVLEKLPGSIRRRVEKKLKRAEKKSIPDRAESINRILGNYGLKDRVVIEVDEPTGVRVSHPKESVGSPHKAPAIETMRGSRSLARDPAGPRKERTTYIKTRGQA